MSSRSCCRLTLIPRRVAGQESTSIKLAAHWRERSRSWVLVSIALALIPHPQPRDLASTPEAHAGSSRVANASGATRVADSRLGPFLLSLPTKNLATKRRSGKRALTLCIGG